MLIREPVICVTSGLSKQKLYELYSNPTISPFNYIEVSQSDQCFSLLLNTITVGKFKVQQLKKILEVTWDSPIHLLNPFQQYLFFYYYLYIIPKGFDWDKQILFNINQWYYLYAYKGWRHLFDLPVNGQRTWSNNKTRYRLKNILYDYQLNCFKRKYGINTKTNLRMSFMSEHINLFWRLEWFEEWLSAYVTFRSTKQKTKFFRLKINYRHLLNLQITTPKSIEHKKKKKNRKKIKSEFTVGFDTLYVVSLFSKKKYLFKHLI